MEPDQPAISEQSKALNRAELDLILHQKPSNSEAIVSFFERKYSDEYHSDAGVWERYTIRQHTLMTMLQFDRYFKAVPLPLGVKPEFFKVILALHDIGKPKAMTVGGKHLQHKYTSEMMAETLMELEYGQQEINIALALVSGDYIGSCLQGGNVELNANNIKSSAKELDLPPKDLLDLMIIFYQVDAGSYTEDAGGKYSLDVLFIFDREKGKMALSSLPKEIVNALKSLVV